MTIYAQPTTSQMNLQNLPVRFDLNSSTGSTLVWDNNKKTFIGLSPDLSSPYVTGAENLGIGNNQIYAGKNGTQLQFKEIIAGLGISAISDGTSITLRANFAADRLSVPGSYRITIDNDNNTNNAAFEVWTARSSAGSPISVRPEILTPLMIPNLFTGNESGFGFFRTINGADLYGAGLRPGMWIKVMGTVAQDGQWQIADITLTNHGSDIYSTLILTVPFTGDAAYNLGGPNHVVTIEQGDLFVPLPDLSLPLPYDPAQTYKLSSYSLDFGPLGLNLVPGMILEIRNTQAGLNGLPSNDGQYTIRQVFPKGPTPLDYSTVLFTSDVPLPGPRGIQFDPQPYNRLITLTVKTFEAPTGFQVDENGLVNANDLVVSNSITVGTNIQGSYTPTNFNDVVRLDNLQDYITTTLPVLIKPQKPLRFFYSQI